MCLKRCSSNLTDKNSNTNIFKSKKNVQNPLNVNKATGQNRPAANSNVCTHVARA